MNEIKPEQNYYQCPHCGYIFIDFEYENLLDTIIDTQKCPCCKMENLNRFYLINRIDPNNFCMRGH